ncbi:hypothetical protein [Natronorubrum sulfidifaciens]|uniref:Uncharacterized protein n=1 Tax=Natronorubrum sulfidifaciens JCM 14089 TaxID=1230460 RepID=L9WG43_9EURY|nr:hypothetical protein [Natronorubrum sulfidifaciens]ELY47293.1 hypothetical protein C495_03507 [Natronorubrum sulfidifaciens JCM 14089]
MADYTSNLKTWGDTGSEYPDGYNYVEGEQPVDAWDNFFNHNAQKDIDHLVSLTNKRLESGKGTNYPGSPENGELCWRSDNSRLAIYDEEYNGWREVAFRSDVAETEADLVPIRDQIDDHEADTTNPHNVTNDQVGAPSTADFAALVDAHNGIAQAVNDHIPNTSNPHNVTASQTGALPTGGGIVTGDIQHEGILLNEDRIITPQVFVDGPVTHDKHAVTKEYVDLSNEVGGGGPWIMSDGDINRSLNTWYQNTTEHPICVYASVGGRAIYQIQISPTVEQNDIMLWDLHSQNESFRLGTPFFVPPNWYYAVVCPETTELVEWTEYALAIGADISYN